MKNKYFLVIFFSLILMLSANNTMARNASITTIDNQYFEGEISSSGNIIEWRKDIYEYKNKNGAIEKFFIKPEVKGSFRLSDIKEIIMIPSSSAPAVYAVLEDGSRAALVQKYLIRFENGKTFYISDFITLDSFYADISGKNGVKRVYISQLKSLKFTGPGPAKRPPEAGTVNKTIQEKPSAFDPNPALEWIKGEKNKFLKKKISIDTPKSPASSPFSYMPFLLLFTGILIIITFWLFIMLFRYRALYSGKIKIKKVKKAKSGIIKEKISLLLASLLKKKKTGRSAVKPKRHSTKRR